MTETSREVKKLEKLKEKQLEEYHRGEAKEQQETIAEHVGVISCGVVLPNKYVTERKAVRRE